MPAFVRPHPESKILISSTRLRDAKRSSTFTEFTLRSFTAFTLVEDAYRTNLDGGQSKIDKNAPRKKAFDKNLLDDIHAAVYYHFKPTIDSHTEASAKHKERFNWKSKVNLMVSKKLLVLNKHFMAIKAGNRNDKKISEEDKEGFQMYQDYIQKVSLFEELDAKIDHQQSSSTVEQSPQLSTQAAYSENEPSFKSKSPSASPHKSKNSKKRKKKKYLTSSSSSSSSSDSELPFAFSSDGDDESNDDEVSLKAVLEMKRQKLLRKLKDLDNQKKKKRSK